MIRTSVYPQPPICELRSAPSAGAYRQRGVTLFELVIVMLIIAILTGIGVPTYRYVTTSSRMSAELNALLGDLQYARSEAVRQGQAVTVCIAAQTTSPYACAAAGAQNWDQGWLVFSDVGDTKNYDSSAGDQMLRVQSAFSSGDTFADTLGVNAISFNRDGFANLGVPQMTVTLKDQSDDAQYTRCLYVSQSGMMTTAMHSTDSYCQ
ncbi:MAG: GspH/FimT family pseudopilin [Steroidobacteraceae bacterium]